jgi:hypothetical protein
MYFCDTATKKNCEKPKIERMEAKKNKKQKSLILKLLEDRKAINECIRKGGDIQKLAEERGLKFAKPL